MARHPASDERSVLGPPAKPRKGERFFVNEIASFLRARRREVAIFLRDQGMLQLVYPGCRRPHLQCTTARGLALCIAHFRAIQGIEYQKGRDLIAERDRRRAVRRGRR